MFSLINKQLILNVRFRPRIFILMSDWTVQIAHLSSLFPLRTPTPFHKKVERLCLGYVIMKHLMELADFCLWRWGDTSQMLGLHAYAFTLETKSTWVAPVMCGCRSSLTVSGVASASMRRASPHTSSLNPPSHLIVSILQSFSVLCVSWMSTKQMLTYSIALIGRFLAETLAMLGGYSNFKMYYHAVCVLVLPHLKPQQTVTSSV